MPHSFLSLFCLLIIIATFIPSVSANPSHAPLLFLFLGGDSARSHAQALNHAGVAGAQIVYSWRQLEPECGKYDFSQIRADYEFLTAHQQQLFVQLQDRSFQPDIINEPDYLLTDPRYHGGVAQQYDVPGEGLPMTTGWVARVWDQAVRGRFQQLMQHLAAEFDGKIYGINLPETAVDFDPLHLPVGFTAINYFLGELENVIHLRLAFQRSVVMQYVNFFPGEWEDDHHFMSALFAYAQKYYFALGGPDVIPYHASQMQNGYPFFHRSSSKLPAIGMAIQEPDYTYHNPVTQKPFTFPEFYNFANDYLGVSILFWNVQEPFFSQQLLPNLPLEGV